MKKLANFAAALCLLSVFGALSSGAAIAQETAGRVLVVAGDLTIIRGAERIAAKVGTEVRAGDTLQVGAQSNAQVLLTDQSIFSLRPDTTMKLAEYAFKDKAPEAQRAIFDLAKGGLRTLTGLIGKANPSNYGVQTATSVIGIRGTHYSLVVCADNCRDGAGTLAANGTYGAVTDGRISVTNQAGETVFGANQYFAVASQASRPEQLVAPPSFLRDALEGRVKAKQDSGEKTEQQATSSSPSGDANITSSTATTTAPVTLTNTVEIVSAATSTQGVATVVQATSTGTVFYRVSGASVPLITCGNPPCGNAMIVGATLGVNLTLQRAAASLTIQDKDGKTLNLGTPTLAGTDGIPITSSNGVLSFSQTLLRSNYPNNQGAFRCQDCGPGGTVGFVDSITYSGTISGTTANLNVAVIDSGGGGSFSVGLTQTALPNTAVGAAVIPTFSGGASATSAAAWQVSVDSGGGLLAIGPEAGALRGSVGTSTNVRVGSAPTTGNLVWGYWSGGGAQLTDANYHSYSTTTSGPASVVPWITGTAPNTLPASLGVLTYVPAGGFVNGTSGTLNSGSLSADFVNRTLSISLNATNTGAGNTFQMNGTTGISAITPRFGAGFTSVTCTGTCASLPLNGSYNGFFAGANAEGAGVAFTAGYGANQPGAGVTGVAAFKR